MTTVLACCFVKAANSHNLDEFTVLSLTQSHFYGTFDDHIHVI